MGRTVSLEPDEDESRALVSVEDRQTGTNSIWLHDLKRGTTARVTFPPVGTIDHGPAFHADGVHVVFTRRNTDTGKSTIMKGRADGTGEPVKIVDGIDFSLSRDGTYLAYDFQKYEDSRRDIAYISLDENAQPHVLREKSTIERRPQISPNGRLLSFSSTESGRPELYITQFPSGEGRWQVSLDGGTRNFWGKDPIKQCLYFFDRTGEVLYRVNVKFGEEDTEPEIGVPERLFDLPKLGVLNYCQVDPSLDGKRFLAPRRADSDRQGNSHDEPKLILVQNWISEFQVSEHKVGE